MITTDKILFEYAKVIRDILSNELSEQDKKNVVETLQKLTLDYRKNPISYTECENTMFLWLVEALDAAKKDTLDIVLNRIGRAIDSYTYYNNK